jgi:hypothetical protein
VRRGQTVFENPGSAGVAPAAGRPALSTGTGRWRRHSREASSHAFFRPCLLRSAISKFVGVERSCRPGEKENEPSANRITASVGLVDVTITGVRL